ncbi:MAG: phenylalanine--tRNA ligase subunit alpha [Gemmatimonadota bacterium]
MSDAGASPLDRLQATPRQGLAAIREAADEAELESARVRYLGRNGELAEIFSQIGTAPAQIRRSLGQGANRVKRALSEAHRLRAAQLERTRSGSGGEADLTLPGRREWRGGVHPVTRVIEEICEIFGDLGFSRVRGPEIESEWYNFRALNIPLDHPAADMHDTFYLTEGTVLRTHTSPVQARIMEKHAPPVRVVVPGMVYRRDPFDPSHAPAFEQIEGLAVDEGVDFVEFRAAIDYFVHRFFGPRAHTRFRPSYFPFTEPSAEVDVSCSLCEGSGCSTCKNTGWLEIMGSGMVHPAVFEAVGYDPERYTGYAFGMGPARIAMLRYRIPDMRLLYEGDLRFLEQFA